MKFEFVRFKAADGVELQGWLNDIDGELAVIHVHGMSGNGYENYFLDNLREVYEKVGLTLFTIDTRGRGIISEFRQGDKTKLAGSCYEIFEESAADITGAIDFLKKLGKTKFILQGHSLGASKVVNYLQTRNPNLLGAILLAPTDMVGWAKLDQKNAGYLKKSAELLAASNGEELVGAQCWSDKTPLSAQTYPSITKEGSAVDIYADRPDGSLLSRVSVPMLIVYGDRDRGITKVDGNIENWQKRTEKILNQDTTIKVIPGSFHSFRQYEEPLANICEEFVRQFP